MADVLPLPTPDRRPRKKRRKLPRLAVDAKELGIVLDCGERTVRTWNAAGNLPAPVKLGGRTLWYLPETRAWMRAGAPPRAVWEAIKAARKK